MSAQTSERAAVTGLTSLPSVNLLPPELHLRRKLRHVQIQLGGAFALAIVAVVALFLVASSSVSTARSGLAVATTQRDGLQKQVDADAGVTATFAQVDTAHGLLRDAGGNEVLWSNYLADIGPRLPADVWLTAVKVAASAPTATGASPGVAQISFEGVALSHVDVASWLDSMAKERAWTDPEFARSEEKIIDGRKTYSFTSTVTVTPVALSGRYTKPAGG